MQGVGTTRGGDLLLQAAGGLLSEPAHPKRAVASTWECEDEKLQEQQARSVFGPGVVLKSAYSFRDATCPGREEVVKKEGVLQKRVLGKAAEWKDRFITLTNDKLYIRNEMGGNIRDAFCLLDITHVKKMSSLGGSSAGGESPVAQGRTQDSTLSSSAGESPEPPQRAQRSLSQQVDSFANGDQNISNLYREQNILPSEWRNVLQVYAERYGRTYYLRAASIRDTEVWRVHM
jgi:hypothetical protein